MALLCDICGKIMTITPGILSYNTEHICITDYEVVRMYDVGDECVYIGMPPELDTEEGHKIQDFCRSFVNKELNAKNRYLVRALRNNTVKKIIDNLIVYNNETT